MTTTSVGATATLFGTNTGADTFKNNGPVTVFIGPDSTVTADTSSTGGWQLHPGEILPSPFASSVSPYGITASGTAYVSRI